MRSLIFAVSILFLNALAAEIEPPPPAPFFTLDLQAHPEISYSEKKALNEKEKTNWESLLAKKRFPIALPLILALIGLSTWAFLKKPAPNVIDEKKLQLASLKMRLENALEALTNHPAKENIREDFIGLDTAFRNLCFFLYGAENKWPEAIHGFFLEHEKKLNTIKFANASPDKQTLSDYVNFCRLSQ